MLKQETSAARSLCRLNHKTSWKWYELRVQSSADWRQTKFGDDKIEKKNQGSCNVRSKSNQGWNQQFKPTPYNTVLLEKLTVPQLVKKIPTFHEILIFVTPLTGSCLYSLSSAGLIQFKPSNPISLIYILILSKRSVYFGLHKKNFVCISLLPVH